MKLKCIVIEDEKMSKDFLEGMIKANQNLLLVQSFDKPVEAVLFLSSNTNIDLIFLDVEMPILNGFEVLDSLTIKPDIVLTTSKKDYAYQGFEYNVKRFLLKPFTLPKFTKIVNGIIHEKKKFMKTEQTPCDNSIFVKGHGAYQNILFKDIKFIEAFGDFVKIHTKEKRIVARSTMKDIEEGIDESKFMRIHRSFIVNLSRITGIEDNAAIIKGTVLPIGKIYRTEFFERVNLL